MNTAKIIEKQKEVCGIITEMNLIILHLNDDDDDDPLTINYNADPITSSESIKYKSCITGKTSNANSDTEQGNSKTKKMLKLLFH